MNSKLSNPAKRKPRGTAPDFETVFAVLNRVETIEKAADHFDVARRTIERVIAGRAALHYCWTRLDQFIDVNNDATQPVHVTQDDIDRARAQEG